MARSTFALSSLALLGLGACVDNADDRVTILQNQNPSSGCSVPAAPTETFVATGLIEGSSVEGYVFTPVVKNYSTLNAEGTDEQQKIAFIHGATVDIAFLNEDLFDDATIDQFRADGLTHFRVPYSGMIAPGGTTSMIFEIVPSDLLNQIAEVLPDDDPSERALLLVSVSIDGALGAGDFETATFQFPVEVCNFCLANVVASCSALPEDFSPEQLGGSCNAAQDTIVDCCSNGTSTVCPAQGTMPPAVQ